MAYATFNSTIDLTDRQRQQRAKLRLRDHWFFVGFVYPSLFALCFQWSSVRGLSLWSYFPDESDGRSNKVIIDWKCHPLESIPVGTFDIKVSNCDALIATRVFLLVFLETSCVGVLLSFYGLLANPVAPSFKTGLGVCLFHVFSTLCGLSALLSASYWLPSTRFERQVGDPVTASFDTTASAIVWLLIGIGIEMLHTLLCGIYTCRIRYSSNSQSLSHHSVVSSLLPVEEV